MTNDSKPIPAASVPERLRQLLGRLGENLIERETPLRLAILSALCGEHLLLIGPPGTAKSALARRMRLAFPKEEGGYFERLLTRFTVPEELFGPLSIKGLEEDRYERQTEKYLPAASIAFLDEIFKANSAILNALLTLLNERQFDNGARRVDVPLIAVVGASNELPESEELNALFDRFLFRYHVPPVSSESFPNLLKVPGNEPTIAPEFRFTADELRQIQREAEEEVALPPNVRDMLGKLRAWCQAENIIVSDRRWRKIVTMLKMSAHSNGRKEVSLWDAWLVQHCVWDKPEQQEKVHKWYEERAGMSSEANNHDLVSMIVQLEKHLKRDNAGVLQATDGRGRALFISASTGGNTPKSEEHLKRDGKYMFLAPEEAHMREDRGNGSYVLSSCTRDNRGKGYSREAIRKMVARSGHNIFHDKKDEDEYLKSRENQLFVDNTPSMGPKLHKPMYVDGRVREMDGILDAVQKHRDFLHKQKKALDDQIHGHLWVPNDFAGTAAVALDNALADTDKLMERANKLRSGFATLPLEEDISAEETEEPEEATKQPDTESDDNEQSANT